MTAKPVMKGVYLVAMGAADAFMNVTGFGDPIGFENFDLGRASQRKLAGLKFDAVGFGHGKSITRNASARLRRHTGI